MCNRKVSRYHHQITIGLNRFRRRIFHLCFHEIFHEGFVMQMQEYWEKISWNRSSVEIRMLAQKVFSPIVHTSVQTWMNVTNNYKSRFILTFSFEIANRKNSNFAKILDLSSDQLWLFFKESSKNAFQNFLETSYEFIR